MPYKNKEDRKAYYERHAKKYNADYKKKKKDEWNKYQREYKVANRAKVYANILKNKKTQSPSLVRKSYIKEYEKLQINKISDLYCKSQLVKQGFTRDQITEEQIELKRLSIIIYRIKNKIKKYEKQD